MKKHKTNICITCNGTSDKGWFHRDQLSILGCCIKIDQQLFILYVCLKLKMFFFAVL